MRLAILGAVLVLGACTSRAQEGGGERAQRDFPVEGFDRVNLAGSHDVVVTVGGTPSVRAEGHSEALDRLDIRVEDGALRIGSRGHGGWNWFGRSRGVTVHVTVPALRAASVAGSGDMRVDRIEGEGFDAVVAGSGDLGIDSVRVGQASFSVTGSGNLRAAGAVTQARIAVMGSGNADLEALETRAADVRVMGSGNAGLRATQRADVTLMGSGNVTVSGGAQCSVTKRGSGDVHCA